MKGWREYSLEQFAILVKDIYKPNGKDDQKYIGLEHIEQETLRLNSVGNSTDVISNKFLFQANDILFGKLRPYFRKVIKPKFSGICSTDIWVLRAKEGFSQEFLFYFIANWDFVDIASSGEGGTRMPRADWDFLCKTRWLLPPLPEQKANAAVLSSLDDKIDFLHRQNKTLEAMAETLFRQWFVEPCKNGLPEGWEEKSLLSLIELVGGGTPKTAVAEYWNGDVPWLTGGDIAVNHKSFVLNAEKQITELGLNNCSTKILPKFATIISARGTVGKYCLLGRPMAFSQSNYGVLPRIPRCFFYVYLLINYVVEELQSSAYGSVFDTITTNTFRGITIPVPPETIILNFESQIGGYFNKVLLNKEQIIILEKLRDTLLPKLISGEVRVKV